MPTPTKLLELRGSWRAKTRRGEPGREVEKPVCPQWLDPEAKALWKRLTARLAEAGLIARLDEFALARYCTLFVRWRACEEWLRAYGTTCQVKNALGEVVGLVSWPQVRQAAVLCEQMGKIEANFGLSPAARARLAQSGDEDAKPARAQSGASKDSQARDKARFFRGRVG
jgi:P27 family predicted phage terminase small subunit